MRLSRFNFRHGGAITALALCSSAVLAQTISPGQVQDTIRQAPELQRPDTSPSLEQPRQRRTEVSNEGKKINVTRFEFAGNTVFSSDVLAELVKSYLDHPVSLSEIYDAADVVTEYYQKNGYGLASVNVPAQKVSEGLVKLEVIEGRLSRISVEGNTRHRSSRIIGALGDVKDGELYRGDELQSGMRRINELPGLKAKAVVSPGDQYGTSDIVIKTTEQLVNGSIALDNYGREQIDEFRLTGQVQINNPFTIEDQLQILALHSDSSHLRYYYGGYSLPVNYFGTRVGINYGRADFIVKNTPVQGYSNNTRVFISHPLIRDFSNTVDLTAGVVRNNSNTRFGGTQIGSNNITLFEFGGTFNHVYASQAVTQVSSTIGTTFKSRPDVVPPTDGSSQDDEFLRWEVDAIHLQPVFERFSVLAHVNAVYSPDPLADSQKFNIGGPQNVRGYPSSELRGDRGYFGSVTLTRPFFAGPVVFTPRVFIDSGRVFNISSIPTVNASDSLTSFGIGTDISFAGANFKLDYGRPLDSRTQSDGRDIGRLFGSLSYAF
jgi:hemolysin activation/secretion protein